MSPTDKKSLRADACRSVATLSDAEREVLSAAIMSRIESLPEFVRAKTVALYRPMPGEVDTAGLLHRWHREKRMAMPVIQGDNLILREYTGEGDIHPGPFGIGEPTRGEEIEPSRIELIVVPGLAFSHRCQRLGRGKGFYDRFLQKTKAVKVGVCFTQCLYSEIACKAHDIDMDIVVTPEEVYRN